MWKNMEKWKKCDIRPVMEKRVEKRVEENIWSGERRADTGGIFFKYLGFFIYLFIKRSINLNELKIFYTWSQITSDNMGLKPSIGNFLNYAVH